jgi:MtN3 and saliva related transmembrane protein
LASVDVIGHDTLGLIAGALTTIAFVPQVVRIVRTRSAHDISWVMFALFSVGIALWLWYGLRLSSLPLIAANVVTLALALVILFLKWQYGRTERRHNVREAGHDVVRNVENDAPPADEVPALNAKEQQ